MGFFKWIRSRLDELLWKRLERPLRFDHISNERRTSRMGNKRIQRAQFFGLFLTLVTSLSARAWDFLDSGPWKTRWGMVAMGSGLALFGLWAYLYWQGRLEEDTENPKV